MNSHGNALPPGFEFEGYRIESVLGAGGFGITYKALEVKLDRHVAIKEYMPRELAMRDPDGATVRPISEKDVSTFEYGLAGFQDEGRTLVRFRHANIVPVLKFFDANGTAYLVMDYVEGQSLQEVLTRHHTLSESEIGEILPQILDGLETVHAGGYLHRDIKPGNIFIRAAEGAPVLIDFGAARQALGEKSKSLTNIITPGYAPFEQYSVRGKQGPWTDIYALGATLYCAVTGDRPPDAADRIHGDDYVPVRAAAKGTYSLDLLTAIDAALVVDPVGRPQSIAEWRTMLRMPSGASAGLGRVAGSGPDVPPRVPGADRTVVAGPRRRRWPVYAAVAAVLVAVSVGGVYAVQEYRAAERQERQAAAEAARRRAAEAERKAAETRRRAEEGRRRAEQTRRQAEQERRQREEAARKAEEERRRKEDAKRRAEATRRVEAERRQKEEAARKAEEERRRKEDAKRRAEEEERRRVAEAEKRRKEEAKRNTEEERRRAEDAKRREKEEAERRAAEAKRRAALEARRNSALMRRRRTEIGAISGRWKGVTRCGRQSVTIIWHLSGKNLPTIHGVEDFYSGAHGRFRMTGRYDRSNRTIHMNPSGWIIKPFGYVALPKIAQVLLGGKSLRVRYLSAGCASFTLQRVSQN